MRYLAITPFSLMCILLWGCSTMDDTNITPEQASRMITADTGIVLLDVRTPAEFNGELGHLKNAVLIPVQDLESRIGEVEQYRGKKILAYCRTGRRSLTATKILRKNGFDAVNVTGGMVEWNKLGLPSVEVEKQ
jgi:rhodanese-related sulfurtransferase